MPLLLLSFLFYRCEASVGKGSGVVAGAYNWRACHFQCDKSRDVSRIFLEALSVSHYRGGDSEKSSILCNNEALYY